MSIAVPAPQQRVVVIVDDDRIGGTSLTEHAVEIPKNTRVKSFADCVSAIEFLKSCKQEGREVVALIARSRGIQGCLTDHIRDNKITEDLRTNLLDKMREKKRSVIKELVFFNYLEKEGLLPQKNRCFIATVLSKADDPTLEPSCAQEGISVISLSETKYTLPLPASVPAR